MTKSEHLERAAKCGLEAAAATQTALTKTVIVMPGWDYYEEQAVRMARLAVWHAFKAQPRLKATR